MSVETTTLVCDWCGEQIGGGALSVTWAAGLRTVSRGWTSRLRFHGSASRPRESCYGAFIEAVFGVLNLRSARGRQLFAPPEDRLALQERAERWRMHRVWRASSAFRDLLDAWRGVPLSPGISHRLADAGYDPARAARASDDELLAISGFGAASLARLRAHLA